jgi:hypothetical protein
MTVKPGVDTMMLEISSLFAMLIYVLIAWALERIVWILFYHPHSLAVSVTESEPMHIIHK